MICLVISHSVSAQTDSVILGWKLVDNFSNRDTVEIDTSLTGFQFYNPVYRNSIANEYLGNLGLPAYPAVYSQKYFQSDFMFAHPLESYMFLPDNSIYYNTRKPFTWLTYNAGGDKNTAEQILKLLHTQNIKPYFNTAIDLQLIGSEGIYPNQKTNDNAISITSSYIKNELDIAASVGVNNLRFENNGGLQHDSLLSEDPEFIPVNLQNATTMLNNFNFQLTPAYRFGKILPIVESDSTNVDSIPKFKHKIMVGVNFNRFSRLYNDDLLAGGGGDNPEDFLFYDNIYADSSQTSDSVYYRNLGFNLQYQLKHLQDSNLPLGLRAGIFSEFKKYAFDEYEWLQLNELVDTLYREKVEQRFNRVYLLLDVFDKLGMTRWGLNAKYDLLGYNSGDYSFSAHLSRDINIGNFPASTELRVMTAAVTPEYLKQHYFSNHYQWNFYEHASNRLRPVKDTRANIDLNLSSINLSISATGSLVQDYVYFNDNGPVQETETIPILALSLNKKLNTWKLHGINKGVFQYSGKQTVLPLPLFSLYHSVFFEQFLFKNVLQVQMGYEIFYNTKYYAHGYSPAIGQFTVQNEKELGNYPYLHGFINLKLKRTRFYFKYMHVNQLLIGDNYFTTLHYPMNPGAFRFGISWTFYN